MDRGDRVWSSALILGCLETPDTGGLTIRATGLDDLSWTNTRELCWAWSLEVGGTE